jgi:DNA-binding NtrC family response regulator
MMTLKAGRALVAISDRENRETLVQVLAACGLESIFCSTAGEVGAVLESEAADVLFCDTAFGEGNFDDLPRAVGSGRLRIPVIVCSPTYDPAVYLEVMNRGAFDFIVYPYRSEDVKWILATAFCRSPEPAPKPLANWDRAVAA